MFDHTFAVVDAVSLGLGLKIGNGFKAFKKVLSKIPFGLGLKKFNQVETVYAAAKSNFFSLKKIVKSELS